MARRRSIRFASCDDADWNKEDKREVILFLQLFSLFFNSMQNGRGTNGTKRLASVSFVGILCL